MNSSKTKKTNTAKGTAKKSVDKAVQVKPSVEKKCCPRCAGCDEAMTDSFIQEVSEEVKNDNLKALWDKYGLFIIIFVVVAVSAAVSFETIKNWRDQKYQAQTSSYLAALQPAADYDNTIKSLEKVAAADNGIYSDLARIQIVEILYEQNKKDEAVAMLQSMIKNEKVSERFQTLAALKLATYQIDTAPAAQLQELLQPIAEQNNAWSPLAKELLAMVAVQEGDLETARGIYVSLIENENISENFKSRVQDMLSALNDK